MSNEVNQPLPKPEVNRQLYHNSSMSGSSSEQDMLENEHRLFNSKDPNFGISSEKPEHRIVILLKAQGLSNTEIAKKTGYTIPWVGQILRQPWAKEKLLAEIRAAGQDEIQHLLSASALDSIQTLIDLRDSKDTENSVRRAAADSLLDRFLGKPTQRVESHSTVVSTSEDIETVERELEELRRESARLTGQTYIAGKN